MKKLIAIAVLGLALASYAMADGVFYTFVVESSSPHALVSKAKKRAVNHTPKSQRYSVEGKGLVRLIVDESVFSAGWDALTLPEKEAYVDAVLDAESEADDASIDAQALIEVVAELTGTPVAQVKRKFKAAKKNKNK